MKAVKKFLMLALIFISSVFIFTGCEKQEEKEPEKTPSYKIGIVIEDGDKKEIFKEEVETEKEILLNVLEDLDVDLTYKDSEYGAYITSLKGIEEKTTKKGSYYWAYYIDGEYAQEGVSSCKVKDGSNYKFVYEYYEKK